MNVLDSSTDLISSSSGITISSSASKTATLSSTSNITLTYSAVSSSTSDVYYQISDQYITARENKTTTITPDLPCSASGTTSISYSLSGYGGGSSPTWVSVNSSTGILTIVAPEVTKDTIYSFYVSSTITGVSSSVQKLIKLTVENWPVWGVSTSAKAITTTSQVVAGTSATVTVWSSMLNTSSLAMLWSMINQAQTLFLILLTRASVPDDVKASITGFEFALNPFDYAPFKKLDFYQSAIKRFNFELSNPLYEPFNIKSDSTIFNTFSFFSMTILMGLVHFWIFVCGKFLSWYGLNWGWACIVRVLRWINNKIYNIMTFGYYIRAIIEITQYILISSISELYRFNVHGSLRVISLAVSSAVIIFWVILIVFTIFLSLSKYTLETN